MAKNILIEIKERLTELIETFPMPLEINRELNILYTFYQRNSPVPATLDRHFKLVIRLTRKLNDNIFKLTSTHHGVSKNLNAYLLSTARDIFAVMSVLGAKEEKEKSYLEEGLALLSSQCAELSLLQSATAKQSVEIDYMIYELENELWDIFRSNPRIKGISIEEIEEIKITIDTITGKAKEAADPFLYCTGIYNLLIYIYCFNLLKKVDLAIKKL